MIPHPSRVLLVIEALAEAGGLAATAEQKTNYIEQIYAFAHVGNNPSCLRHHSDWVDEFYKVEDQLINSNTIPDIRGVPHGC